MGTLQFYISDFQNDPSYSKQKEFLKSYEGNLKQFNLSSWISASPYSNLPPKHVRHNTLIISLVHDFIFIVDYLGNKKCLGLSCPFEENQIEFEPFASKK